MAGSGDINGIVFCHAYILYQIRRYKFVNRLFIRWTWWRRRCCLQIFNGDDSDKAGERIPCDDDVNKYYRSDLHRIHSRACSKAHGLRPKAGIISEGRHLRWLHYFFHFQQRKSAITEIRTLPLFFHLHHR